MADIEKRPSATRGALQNPDGETVTRRPGARQAVGIYVTEDRLIEGIVARESDLIAARQRLRRDHPDFLEVMDDDEIRERLQAHSDRLFRVPDADVLIGRSEHEGHDWVVPDMLEVSDRLILTGGEGKGKSTLIRQWLVQISCGIHPLTGEDIDPVPVLLIDLENGKLRVGRELAKLEVAAGDRWIPGMFRSHAISEGWNLLEERAQQQLLDMVEATDAEVVAIDPLYNAAPGEDLIDERVSSRLQSFFNDLRTSCALLIAAHSPSESGRSKRPERPYGSSLWRRWPEFGIFLSDDGSLRHWRDPREADYVWPARLQRGGDWPWTPLDMDRGDRRWWREIKALWQRLGRRPKSGEIFAELGIPRATASRAINDNKDDWPS